MKDQSKTKQVLIQELASLRQAVAELKQSESERNKELLESEAYRVLFDESTQGILAADIETQRFVWANPNICWMFGYSKAEMLQLAIADIHPKESLDRAISAFKSHIQGEKPQASALPCLRKDGTVFYADVSGFNTIIKGRSCSVGFFTDVTERNRAEEALRQEKVFAESLVKTAQTIVLVLGTTGHIISFNQYMEEISGYRLEEVQGKDWFSTFLPERDRNSTRELFLKAINDIQTRGNVNSIVTKDGRERIIEWYDKTLKDEKGNTVGLLSTGQDVTERKQVEDALRKSEEKYRTLVDNASDIVFRTDDTGHFTFVNPVVLSVTGYKEEEMIGKHYSTLIRPDMREESVKFFGRQFVKGIKNTYSEFPILTKEGHEVWLGQHIQLIVEDGHVIGFQAVSRNITERKRAEEELLNTLRQLQETKDMLVQSEKLAAIGRLSAGVGHEILNPLNIISMRMQFLEMTEKLPDKVKEAFVTMFKQIDRIVKITKDLSQFSRISKRDMVKKDINQLIQHIISLVIHRLRVEQVALVTELQPDLPQTLMDPDRIEQVVVNLINNAVDALDGRENKVIRITSGLTRREGRDYLRLAISDNGMGIPKENVDKLFDPFFTTKETGKGTGLGLHICYTIIQEHEGRIWAETNAEGGASFFIEFPIEEQEIKP